MRNDIDKVTRIVVFFPVLWKTKIEGAAAYVCMLIDSPFRWLGLVIQAKQNNEFRKI